MNKFYILFTFLFLTTSVTNAQDLAFKHTFEESTRYIYISDIPETEDLILVTMKEKDNQCVRYLPSTVTIKSDSLVLNDNTVWKMEWVDNDEMRFIFPPRNGKTKSVVYKQVSKDDIPLRSCLLNGREL